MGDDLVRPLINHEAVLKHGRAYFPASCGEFDSPVEFPPFIVPRAIS